MPSYTGRMMDSMPRRRAPDKPQLMMRSIAVRGTRVCEWALAKLLAALNNPHQEYRASELPLPPRPSDVACTDYHAHFEGMLPIAVRRTSASWCVYPVATSSEVCPASFMRSSFETPWLAIAVTKPCRKEWNDFAKLKIVMDEFTQDDLVVAGTSSEPDEDLIEDVTTEVQTEPKE